MAGPGYEPGPVFYTIFPSFSQNTAITAGVKQHFVNISSALMWQKMDSLLNFSLKMPIKRKKLLTCVAL
jgi:hypothetical protein